jgi:hypothetical protein
MKAKKKVETKERKKTLLQMLQEFARGRGRGEQGVIVNKDRKKKRKKRRRAKRKSERD